MIEITYELECLPENPDAPSHGNAWTWCYVHVTAEIEFEDHSFTGHAYQGDLSYVSEQDFRDSAYFADMTLEAKQALIQELIRAVKAGDVAARIIKQIS